MRIFEMWIENCKWLCADDKIVVISMQTRNMSGDFIQILTTRTTELVTGRSLKRDNLLGLQVA